MSFIFDDVHLEVKFYEDKLNVKFIGRKDRDFDSLLVISMDVILARSTTSNIFVYPVHRQRFPSIALRISSSLGSGFESKRAFNVSIMPGVQKPH